MPTREQDKSRYLVQGGEAAPEAVVRRGMADVTRRLRVGASRHVVEQRAHTRARDPLRRAVLSSLGESADLGRAVGQLRTLDSGAGKQRVTVPKPARDLPRIAMGSIVVTRVPPYDYPWSWQWQAGGASVGSSANRSSGGMSFSLWNNSRDASASAAAALGVYFRPSVANGILRLSSSPAFNYLWWTYCAFASAHSDGWIGLYVGRYTLGGGFDGSSVDQRLSLWSDDSWWSGAGTQSGSTSAYPLFAQFNVDSAHWYALWVWCGGYVHGAGWGGAFSGSGAGAQMSVAVPSMTMELF
jgi:hypothetical protein